MNKAWTSAYLKGSTRDQILAEIDAAMIELKKDPDSAMSYLNAFTVACGSMGFDPDFAKSSNMIGIGAWMRRKGIPVSALNPMNHDFFTAIAEIVPRADFMRAMSNCGLT